MLRVLVRALHKERAMGVVVCHCITCFQTQLILAACPILYHSQCGIIAALTSSERQR